MRTRVGVSMLVMLVGAGCPRRTERSPAIAEDLVVRVVPVAAPRYRPDEYLQLVATRAHVARPKTGGVWRKMGSYLLDRSSSALLTVGVQVNGQAFGVFPLVTIKTASGAVTREAKENQPLAAPLRLQQGDQLTIQASLIEVEEGKETMLVDAAKKVGTVASIPVSTAVPGGQLAFDMAAQFWQLARVAGKPQDVTLKKEGGLDRPLWEVDRIELVPTADVPRFTAERARLLDPQAALRDDDPTFVVIQVVRRDRLYDPNLVLAESSPVRAKIMPYLEEMRDGTDIEKVKSCRRLRRYLRTTLGVNPADETTIVLAAMREGGYDPDRSQGHLEGCLTTEHIRASIRGGFQWGSCEASAPCRLAREFADAWLGRRSLAAITTAPIAVYDRLFKNGVREDIDPGDFVEWLVLAPSWESPIGESESAAAFRGAVSRDGETRPARVRVSVSYESEPRIGRVDVCAPDATSPECRAPAP